MRITPMEEKFMRAIPQQDFYEDGLDSVLWTDCLLDDLSEQGLSTKQTRAILSTLQQKEMICVSGKGRDCSLSLLEAGKQWLIENGVVNDKGRSAKNARLDALGAVKAALNYAAPLFDPNSLEEKALHKMFSDIDQMRKAL